MAEAARAWHGPQIARLRDGRLHMQDGPIDLVIEAWGEKAAVETAFRAACERFDGLLASLCAELPMLRQQVRSSRTFNLPILSLQNNGVGRHSLPTSSWDPRASRLENGPSSRGKISSGNACDDVGREFANPTAQRMYDAVAPYSSETFITPMAAVAGAVAEAVLAAMTDAAALDRAYVNNGGDIALHLAPSQTFDIGLIDRPDRPSLFAKARITSDDRIGGIATSGWRGRSFSLGIADAVTVLAERAADADAAATIIANAIDLPRHPGVGRVPASDLQPDSDLGTRLVTRDVPLLDRSERAQALSAGEVTAGRLIAQGRIRAAALHLQDETRIVGASSHSFLTEPAHA